MSGGIFTREALDKLIADTLPADGEPGQKVLVGTVDQKGAKVAAQFTFEGGWQLEAAAHKDWHGDVGAGARVIKRW